MSHRFITADIEVPSDVADAIEAGDRALRAEWGDDGGVRLTVNVHAGAPSGVGINITIAGRHCKVSQPPFCLCGPGRVAFATADDITAAVRWCMGDGAEPMPWFTYGQPEGV